VVLAMPPTQACDLLAASGQQDGTLHRRIVEVNFS
jgi:hypothetical protein